MTVGPREVARRAIRRVDGDGAYLSLALGGEIERAKLSDDDRGLATEIAYGVVRNRARIDRALASYAPRGIASLSSKVRIALAVAGYQLMFLERVPDYAVVDDAVEAISVLAGKKVAGFANALLRNLATKGEPPVPDTADVKKRAKLLYSLPGWMVRQLLSAVGEQRLLETADGLSRSAATWARFDPNRVSVDEIAATIGQERPSARCTKSPLGPHGLLLTGYGSPEASESFQQGLWTVQDLGAQLVSLMADVRPGMRVLDACAGVGGKSTHLAQMVGDSGQVDAIDTSRRKLDLLSEACRRMGLENVRDLVMDASELGPPLDEQYDRVVLDAPCSGLGVLRRHPELRSRAVEQSLADLAALQERLLDAAAARVGAGGLLVYSVCTFTQVEGPEQIARFVGRHSEFSLECPEGSGVDWQQVVQADGTVRTWPHLHNADAFFAARLRRL